MRNIWIICRKEMRSYFASPVAYLLLTMFAFIFGLFFWNILGYFVQMGTASHDAGPGDADEYQRRGHSSAAGEH